MYELNELPVYQLGGRVAGTDYDKIVALVDAYTEARCRLYTTSVGTPQFILHQQVVIALGRALNEALLQVTSRA
jgi:hypothetical protein